jgi:hypothetical protein
MCRAHPETLLRYGLLAWTRVSANFEKDSGSEWAVRVGRRLLSRFEKSGATLKLSLVQISEEVLIIKGDFPNT